MNSTNPYKLQSHDLYIPQAQSQNKKKGFFSVNQFLIIMTKGNYFFITISKKKRRVLSILKYTKDSNDDTTAIILRVSFNEAISTNLFLRHQRSQKSWFIQLEIPQRPVLITTTITTRCFSNWIARHPFEKNTTSTNITFASVKVLTPPPALKELSVGFVYK